MGGGLNALINPVGAIADAVDPKDKDDDKTPAAPVPATPDRESSAAALAEADTEARRRRAGGRSSTVLTGALGDVGSGSSSRKTLLGQ